MALTEKKKLYQRAYRKAYPELVRAHEQRFRAKQIRERRWTLHSPKSTRMMLITRLAEVRTEGIIYCECCSKSRIEFMTVDHINSSGRQERKTMGSPGTHAMYRSRLERDDMSGLRVLCINCNMVKQYWGYCPHEKEASELLTK
jgi:hypothetical protein